MEFDEVVIKRRSVRDYDASKEVTDEQLKELFELVKLSPSSYNLQPWEFIVVRDKENKKLLKACANNQQFVEDASATVIVLGSTNPLVHAEEISADRVKKGTMDEEKKKKFEENVKKIAENKPEAMLWTAKSTSLSIMTLMLAAENMGLATCPIGGFDDECIKKEFNIPEDYEIMMLITLGYKSEKQSERPKRYGYEDIVHLEKFGEK
ncbi:NAD(P)H nitroreductase [Candidatus Woesearchaeota archaeon]|nr:NAD(P)H nitroreductase [Candidatus Woesearchaeota archaeon]|tara:strand:- start:7572 stop:8195 length:624 start_codon:yes stop_codon:yes gene_type:complete